MNDFFSRRDFLTGISFSALAAIYPANFLSFLEKESKLTEPKSLLKPKALKPGDTVGLVAPASAIAEREQAAIAKEVLESFGFKVVLGKNVLGHYGYLAGSDEERAADINTMFRRDDVDGVFPWQGGWGSMRLLPYLDFEVIRKNPKVFIGFSDITTLLLAFYKFAGLVVFHGPNVASSFNSYTFDYYIRSFTKKEPLGMLQQPPLPDGETVDKENRIITIRGGKAAGALVGGNLSLLVTTLGTPFEINYKNKILFLEDVHEEPYRIDRMLTHLELSGTLSSAAGIVIGKCRDCEPKDAGYSGSLTLEELFKTKFEKLGVPVISGVSFGHIKNHITLPIGVQATLDADAKTLTINESAVV
ncbi:MAG: LD-carboxypeptidase [Bacteroidetes bacterium]|nr:LD-carboxypeptidase [Bacteroidota bacterium]